MKKRLHSFRAIKYLFLFLITLGFYTTVEAQDPRFSQFYAAPMHLNPALTGVLTGVGERL